MSTARIAAAVLAAAPLLLLGGCGSEAPRRNVLLVTFDTTRADVLAPYSGRADLTPNIAQLAREGLVFDDASTVAPLTLPSHASMLTGLYPPAHGLRENGIAPLPPSARTLAESALDAGYQTAAFVAALVLDASFGLDQGFEEYAGPARAGSSQSSHTAELTADVVVDRALAWLANRDEDRPFLLWVHLFDPHGPYQPPPRYRPKGTNDPRGLYIGEIGFADAQFGRLLDALRSDGTLDETFVAFTADHGEAFGEHGEPTHGAFVWDTTIRVPLILRDPQGRRAGERTDTVVGVTDLHPTLMEVMGQPTHDSVQGTSLLPLLDGQALDPDRGVYFESYSGYLSYGWSHLAGWRDAEGKYVHSSKPQLFEPRSDPGEARDLLAEGPLEIRARRYQNALGLLSSQEPLVAEQVEDTDAELLESIRALGYAGVNAGGTELPEPLEASDRPAPQDNADVYRESLRAQELSNRGEYEQAEQILSELVRRQPNNPFVLDRLSTVLVRLNRPAAAIPYLERLLEIGPGWAGSYCNLGLAYYEVGQVDNAVARLLQAIAKDGEEPFFWDTLLRVLEESGRTEELAQWRAKRAEGARN